MISLAVSSMPSFAASIILNTGAAIKGKIIEEKEDSILFQYAETKQVIKIKLETIREIQLDPDEKKLSDKNRQLKLMKEDSDIVGVIQPSLGILPGIAYPFNRIGKNLALGYGGHIFFDVGIPMRPEIFKLRFGLSAGFMYHRTKSSDYASSLMLLPITGYMKFQFITAAGIRPYIKIGGGITPVLGGSSTSFDPTVTASVGLGYIHSSLPNMEFFIDAGMMMAFEKVRGDFITASAGVAYRFGAPPPKTTVRTTVKK